MVTYTGRYTASQAAASPAASSVSFGADVSQAPVYLNVEVLPGQAFARLMLALGRVVRMRDTAVKITPLTGMGAGPIPERAG